MFSVLQATLPMFVELRQHYAILCASRDATAKIYQSFDGTKYTTLTGDVLSRFRPASLPPAKNLPSLTELFADESKYNPPSQKVLSSIVDHSNWLAQYDACCIFDATSTDTTIRHREASRLIAVSQFASGTWLDVDPDSSLPHAKQRTPLFNIGVQRRLGLYLSAARSANDTLASCGKLVDYLGDDLCNSGEHGSRHHAVNRAFYNALVAVATGPVVLGDKERRDVYEMYNVGHCADLIQPGASTWGT